MRGGKNALNTMQNWLSLSSNWKHHWCNTARVGPHFSSDGFDHFFDLYLVPGCSVADWQAAALFGNRKNIKTLSWGLPCEHCTGCSIILGVPHRVLAHTTQYSPEQLPNMGVSAVPAGAVDAAPLQGWDYKSARPGCPTPLDLGTAKNYGHI